MDFLKGAIAKKRKEAADAKARLGKKYVRRGEAEEALGTICVVCVCVYAERCMRQLNEQR